jgi:GNAT superfamily N-acetyltransferase
MEKRMDAPVSCRAASKEDISEVLRLYAQPELDNGKVLSLSEAECLFERIAGYPDYKIYIAFCKGHIIGTFALLIMNNLAHMGAPSAVIEDVAVDPDWQGRGVGKLMMKYALQICGEKGCYKAVLSSNLKHDRAHAFYESLDFERHGYSYRINAQPNSPPDAPQAALR